jgi:hypothetical protein
MCRPGRPRNFAALQHNGAFTRGAGAIASIFLHCTKIFEGGGWPGGEGFSGDDSSEFVKPLIE